MLQYRAFSAGLPLVKPTWILDSVAANRLLPCKLFPFLMHLYSFSLLTFYFHSKAQVMQIYAFIGLPYQLHQLANNQPTLSAFFSFKTSKLSDMEDSTTNVCQSQDRHSSKVNGLISTVSNDTIPENQNTNAFMLEDSTNLVRVKYDEGSTAATQEKTNVQDELEPNHQEPSTSDDQNVKEFQSSAATRLSKQGHSTLTDPNFVQNYFKVGKLEEVSIFILLGEMVTFLLVAPFLFCLDSTSTRDKIKIELIKTWNPCLIS